MRSLFPWLTRKSLTSRQLWHTTAAACHPVCLRSFTQVSLINWLIRPSTVKLLLVFFPLLFICFSLEEDGRSEVVMSPAYVSIKTALCSPKTSSLQTSEDSSTLMTRSCRGGETQATALFPSCSQEPTFDELNFEFSVGHRSQFRVKRKIFDLGRVGEKWAEATLLGTVRLISSSHGSRKMVKEGNLRDSECHKCSQTDDLLTFSQDHNHL